MLAALTEIDSSFIVAGKGRQFEWQTGNLAAIIAYEMGMVMVVVMTA